MFLEERNVGREAAGKYAELVLRQDRKMRKWLVGVRANGVEAIYLNISLSQYESLRIHSGEYSPKDTSRIREDLRTRPADFVAESNEDWA